MATRKAEPGARPSIGASDRSLRDQVYEAIRDRIIDGELEPGRRLVERDLAEDYEVSRVPVREAMQRLEGEGFLTNLPRRGAIVSRVDRAEAEHFFDVREYLEALAAGLAARRADPAGLRRLRELLDRSRRADARGRVEESATLNAEFHRAIVEMSGNPLLRSLMEPLDGRLHRLFRLTSRPDDASTMCGEHQQLFEVISAGDEQGAADLMRRHVASTRAAALAVLASLDSPAAAESPATAD